MPFRISLEKENFKFSCSHFTILGADHAERLHGHNYYVSVVLDVPTLDADLGLAFDFNAVKPLVRQLADELDEYVLIPHESPYLTVGQTDKDVHVKFANKFYSLPVADVRLLPVVNITSEELAKWFAERLSETFKSDKNLKNRISKLTVGIQETRGQKVDYELGL